MADTNVGAEGMANLAHAIRRSTALYVAMSITPPEASVDDMLATADRLATWVGGKAAAAHPAPVEPPPPTPPPTDGGFLGANPWADS